MAEGSETAGAGLQDALERLCSSRTLRLKPETPVCVAVIGLDRYLSDERVTDGYSYDVTVTDGRWRVKCHLSSALHPLVQSNALRCGSCVSVTQLSFVYDERRVGQSYVCLEELECGGEDAGILSSIKTLNALRWWTRDEIGNSMLWHADAPLQSGRKHYLSLWNNEDPHGGVWIPSTPPPDTVIDVSKICLLGDLDVFFASSRRPLPLLVRVLHRSRLRYYGKPGQNIDFPFQAYFEVADQSGVMSMVLWNDLCPEWYHRLVVGSVVYLQHYSLKKSYQNRSRPQISSLPLLSFTNTEICLNPRSPSAIITVIPPKGVQPQWSLPDITYNFSTRHEIESLSSNQACDVIGLVTYVGRVERIRNRNSIPEKFWTYRWVHAVDGTSGSPFILEIFASSQPDIFNNICPMTYLVCTQMRVCREACCSVYLTSSTETQLFITGCHKKQPYVSDPKVKAFIQWTKTLKDSVILRKTAVGGHYCYPPPSPTFTPHTTTANTTATAGQGASLPLMAVADLQGEIESLQYRECRRFAIQGHITAVRYHHWPQKALQSGVTAEQNAPQRIQQLEGGSVAASGGSAPSSSTGNMEQSERPSAAPPSDSTSSPKRRRIDQGSKALQGSYWTRAKVQSERQMKLLEEEEEGGEEGESNQTTWTAQSPHITDNSETGSVPDSQPPIVQPSASWESSMWPLLKQDVTTCISCGSLDPESVPERFRFDDRDVLLHRINLSPSRWTPDVPLSTSSETHTPVDCAGYLTLTVLGLNQQAAVDVLFIPVFSPEDPRGVGMPARVHDNTLMSCLSSGHMCVQADGTHLSAEALMSSAPALEEERLVCVLDVCLLGQNKVEIMCSKIYRTADITPV
ncbi:RPA-related protein RADX [Pygocentrus nattereri]|uniref:RPA-related protein RADX-like n=1 Tax=Pygocentrus nattereri TaxID=42514 RepID=A0A3B4DJK8_PYGNA|nr:RPA-related protein RADX [Pygocentrus nattereri]